MRTLLLANIRVGFEKQDLRPAMVCDDVDGIDIDNFKASMADGVSPAKFTNAKDVVIRNSPVLKDVGAQ